MRHAACAAPQDAAARRWPGNGLRLRSGPLSAGASAEPRRQEGERGSWCGGFRGRHVEEARRGSRRCGRDFGTLWCSGRPSGLRNCSRVRVNAFTGARDPDHAHSRRSALCLRVCSGNAARAVSRATGPLARQIPSRPVNGVPAAARPGDSLGRAMARHLQSGSGRRSLSTIVSLSPTPESSLHGCPLVRCVNPLSQRPYPFFPAAQRRSPRGTRGTGAEPRGSLPIASAGVKWAQRKPRDARESASARRGACAPIAGAVPRIRVKRPPVSRRSLADQLARAAQQRRLL